MAGRKHLLSEDGNGTVRKVKVDPKNIEKQMREERAAGRRPYVLDDDDMIRFGRITQALRDGRGRNR